MLRSSDYFPETKLKKKRERGTDKVTMKRTGSGVLALTAALTASSIFRESMCLSRYSCTDIFREQLVEAASSCSFEGFE